MRVGARFYREHLVWKTVSSLNMARLCYEHLRKQPILDTGLIRDQAESGICAALSLLAVGPTAHHHRSGDSLGLCIVVLATKRFLSKSQ